MVIDPESFRAAIDREMLIDLAKEVINVPSPTGEEAELAQDLERIWSDIGLEAQTQTLYEDRLNVVGRLRGTRSDAPSVMLSGHLDTSVRGDEPWLEGPGWKNNAVVLDNKWIYGNGIFNMKNALVSYTVMAATMRKLGIELPGDVILAGTAGEIELAGVDEFQGQQFDSVGAGMRHLLSHGVAPDYHILGEPTGMIPLTGMMGCLWTKVETHGDFAHTAFSAKQTNAIEEAWELWRGLDGWINEFCESNVYLGVRPVVNRAAIRGGAPWRVARTPSSCAVYLDIRFPPTFYPADVQRMLITEVQRIAEEKLTRGANVDFFVARPGTQLPVAHPVVESMVNAHSTVMNETIQPQFSPPYCTDAIDSNRYGVPTIVYGAGGKTLHDAAAQTSNQDIRAKNGEYMFIDDMIDVAVTYAVATADLISQGAEGIQRSRTLVPLPGVVTG